MNLLERGAESGHQRRGQVPDEPHGVREQHRAPTRKDDAPHRRVQRGKKPILREDRSVPGEGLQQGGLSAVRIPDQGHRRDSPFLPPIPDEATLPPHVLQLPGDLAHAPLQPAAVAFEFRLAGPARPDPRPRPGHLKPQSLQVGDLVARQGQLHLEARLRRDRPPLEDLHDDERPVPDRRPRELLQRALLHGGKPLVDDDVTGRPREAEQADFLRLAPADQAGGVGGLPALHDAPQNLYAQGAQQQRQLVEGALGLSLPVRKGEPHQDRPRAGRSRPPLRPTPTQGPSWRPSALP